MIHYSPLSASAGTIFIRIIFTQEKLNKNTTKTQTTTALRHTVTWGPCSVLASKGSPTSRFLAYSTLRLTNSGYICSSTNTREAAVQHCPWLKNTPWWAHSTAKSTATQPKREKCYHMHSFSLPVFPDLFLPFSFESLLKKCWQWSTPIEGTHKVSFCPQTRSLIISTPPSCLLSQGLVCHSSWYFLPQGLTEGSNQFFLLWEFRCGFLDILRGFLKTSFSSNCLESRARFCCTASSDQVLAMPIIRRWHKYLWLSTSAVLCKRMKTVFPKPNRIFQPLWRLQVTHISYHYSLMQHSHNGTCEMSPADPQDRGEGWINKVLQNSPVIGMPVEGLHFRKLLSPLLGSGSAVLPMKEKAPQQQKRTNARFICNCSHPQGRQQYNDLLICHGNDPCAG